MFWDSAVSYGALTTWLMWTLAFALIGANVLGLHPSIGMAGLGLAVAAAALTIVRDNQRTRRMVRAAMNNDELTRLR